MSGCAPRHFTIVAVVLACTGLAVPTHAEGPQPAAMPRSYSFHHEHILGTSLDLWVTTRAEADADAAEHAALGEIERLRQIFSTYDPASELSVLNRTNGPARASTEMIEVLRLYETWERRSGGAFNGRVGDLVKVWKEAERLGREPDAGVLERIATDLRRPGWELDDNRRTVTRLTDQPLNLNAVAKGYIIRKAVQAIREKVPGIGGGLLNLGGDITTWGKTETGSSGWPIAIQDPFHPEENAQPLGGFFLTDAAVATSGGYQRDTTIAGKRYSHIFDPRTGRPTGHIAGATVLAPDSTTANALATTLCVLTAEEGLKLVATVPGAECLIVTAEGKQIRSPGFTLLPVVSTRTDDKKDEKKDDKKGEPWPEGFQVTVAVELPKLEVGKYRRPYVAVWIEDADGKAVRTLTVWGNAQKYLKDLNDWWKIGKEDTALVKAVTRATRGPGKYDVVWDGKDDKGNAVPQGIYTVRVEVHREYGKHLRQSGKIECKAEGAKLTLDKNDETGDTLVEYGKKK